MEAEGIEPSSQDNVDVGLYMFIWSFDLDAGDEDHHPFAGVQTLGSVSLHSQRPSYKASLLFSARASQTSTLCRDHLLFRQPIANAGALQETGKRPATSLLLAIMFCSRD